MSGVEDLHAYLRSLDAETLAGLLYEQAERDPEFAARLRRRAGDLGDVGDLLDGALPDGDRRPDGLGGGEAAKISAVLDTLQRLLDAGSRTDLAPLARRTVDRIVAALGRVGAASGRSAAELHRAVKLYARACAAHPQQPDRLADWILDLEFDAPGRIELADFATALGKPGLTLIKSTVDSVLADPAAPDHRRRAAQRLAEQLAEISGDVDTLLTILSRRLPPLDANLKIVRVLRAAGRTSEAMAHAARALARASGPVAEVAGETPGETRRLEKALAVRRTEFERSPTLATYAALRETATELRRWDAEREEALRRLRDRAGEPATADELVRVLLAEDRPAEAWQVALRHECSLSVKIELAEATEADHPADAIAVYRQQVDALIDHKDPDHYRQAARRLKKLRALYRVAGRAPEFADYLAGLVSVHRRKARLLAEIRDARIAVPPTRSPR
jgi:hypothetical protein